VLVFVPAPKYLILVPVWCQHQNIIVSNIVAIKSVLGTILVLVWCQHQNILYVKLCD
jgi:hypothetical protein